VRSQLLEKIAESFRRSAGTIVFGMEDGTVSICGLILGVAATTDNAKAILIAGASGAIAAAVSMMAGAYLDFETTRDQKKDLRQSSASSAGASAALAERLAQTSLTAEQAQTLSAMVENNLTATQSLLLALDDDAGQVPLNPSEQAFWMLIANFFAAAIPILPFVIFPVFQARIVSGAMTAVLLIGLGVGRAKIVKRSTLPTVLETVSIGVAAATAGVGISMIIDNL
jgi:VIT1/CCC1 family predicted Fe2+/Mn2+ transporter